MKNKLINNLFFIVYLTLSFITSSFWAKNYVLAQEIGPDRICHRNNLCIANGGREINEPFCPNGVCKCDIDISRDKSLPVLFLIGASAPNLIARNNFQYYVGDKWTIKVYGPPNSPVYFKWWKNGSPYVPPQYRAESDGWTRLGQTDQNGYFTHSGVFDSSVVGSWTEQVKVGDKVSVRINFTVNNNPPERRCTIENRLCYLTTPPSFQTIDGFLGSDICGCDTSYTKPNSSTTVTLINLTNPNSSDFRVGDTFKLTIKGDPYALVKTNWYNDLYMMHQDWNLPAWLYPGFLYSDQILSSLSLRYSIDQFSSIIGQLDENGIFELTGTFTSDLYGRWKEDFRLIKFIGGLYNTVAPNSPIGILIYEMPEKKTITFKVDDERCGGDEKWGIAFNKQAAIECAQLAEKQGRARGYNIYCRVNEIRDPDPDVARYWRDQGVNWEGKYYETKCYFFKSNNAIRFEIPAEDLVGSRVAPSDIGLRQTGIFHKPYMGNGDEFIIPSESLYEIRIPPCEYSEPRTGRTIVLVYGDRSKVCGSSGDFVLPPSPRPVPTSTPTTTSPTPITTPTTTQPTPIIPTSTPTTTSSSQLLMILLQMLLEILRRYMGLLGG